MLPSNLNLPEAEAPLLPHGLTCEDGVRVTDVARPRLSWRLESPVGSRGQKQTAYRILAASDPALLIEGKADLWDTGKAASSQSVGVVWGGKPLAPRQEVFWTVQVWDRDDRPSGYPDRLPQGRNRQGKQPAAFELGLMHESEWSARWIGAARPQLADPETLFGDNPAPLLRKEFRVRGNVTKARAYFVGLGIGRLHLNGDTHGATLDPPWTRFDRRIHYRVHDVTDRLRQGVNAVGMELGNGWYNPLPLKMWGHLNLREQLPVGQPRGLLQLEIEYADGRTERVVSDESWHWSDGPVLRNSLYLGEVYDARREQPGWDTAGFTAELWRPVSVLDAPGGRLIASPVAPTLPQPLSTFLETESRAVSSPKPGLWVVDFGVNFTGVVELTVDAPAGTRIDLKAGELLHPDGTVNGLTSACGQIKNRSVPPGSDAPSTAYQHDAYICKGVPMESWSPRFTYHGFRYVEVTGLPSPPPTLSGRMVRTIGMAASRFDCGEPLLEKLFRVTRHTFGCNMVHVQSDCPHREKFGYGGDIVATADTALSLFDMGAFYAKAVEDFADAVRSNGGFTETAPFVGIADSGLGERSGPIEWGTAFPLLLERLYRHYGNRSLVEAHYPAAARWFALLESKAVEGILDNGLGDHETLVPRSTAVTGTAFYFWNAQLLARLATFLGTTDEAKRYEAAAQAIRSAFRRKFVEGGKVGLGSQTCQAAALALGLAVDTGTTLKRLVADIESRGTHLTTGIFGTYWLLPALSAHGRADVAFALARQRSFPSWGYMLDNGATTLWETWAHSDNVYSHNHPMFGSVAGWMVEWLAGIRIADDACGCDRVLLSPRPPAALPHARAALSTVRGELVCGWKWGDGGALELEAQIPTGVTALLELPAARGARVTESGQPAERAGGVAFQSHAGGLWRAQLASGSYAFRVG